MTDGYNFNFEPYYFGEKKYSTSNKLKAKLGEEAFTEALESYYPVIANITYGKRQGDIDHLILTPDCVVMNECKNIKEDWIIEYSWFLSHVVDRYANGLPVAQYYATTMGYSTKITFTLTIPKFNTENQIVHEAKKGLRINVIETEKQILNKRSKHRWYKPIRNKFLSVVQLIPPSIVYSGCSSQEMAGFEKKFRGKNRKRNKVKKGLLPSYQTFPKIQKRKREQKTEKITCVKRAIVICNQYKPFYCCLDELWSAVERQVENELCSESHNCQSCPERFKLLEIDGQEIIADNGCPFSMLIERETEARIYGIFLENEDKQASMVWSKDNRFFIRCSCQPTVFDMDGGIIERNFLSETSEFEPCNLKCSELRSQRRCSGIKEPKRKQQQSTLYVGWAFSSK